MLAIFQRTYLVVGNNRAPEVLLLTEQEHEIYLDRSMSNNEHRKADAVRYVFGTGFDTAFAAWHEALMRSLGEGYEGPFEREVRALAAAIVLNIPFQTMFENQKKTGKDGGAGDRLQPVPVVQPPSGVAVAS